MKCGTWVLVDLCITIHLYCIEDLFIIMHYTCVVHACLWAIMNFGSRSMLWTCLIGVMFVQCWKYKFDASCVFHSEQVCSAASFLSCFVSSVIGLLRNILYHYVEHGLCFTFMSLVTSCVGLREQPQTAFPMSFTWASHVAAIMLTGC